MALVRKIVFTPDAPTPVGPYSQAVIADQTLYISGIIGLDPKSGSLVEGGTVEQFRQCMRHLEEILYSCESAFENVSKTTIFLTDMEEFSQINDVYKEYFCRDFPARSTIQVVQLPLNANVEIEAIALIGCVKTIPAPPPPPKCSSR
ncbi:2-iminobutanoate/2-iminopropanoate deaminase-like [Agrilus planipennis]|uniref:2-iminobutanoate/2-iminopropanoate deaminase-like n=1 Tax=Agrilus planipennis TaxID=224129 RepID=A0A1W4W724_AGRPL|nr:2-iminobutanoate/2-iminopropanoate deaminase-like [Agrilus planipennis]